MWIHVSFIEDNDQKRRKKEEDEKRGRIVCVAKTLYIIRGEKSLNRLHTLTLPLKLELRDQTFN